MTEYDYSPAALEAHMAKQRSISSWTAATSAQHHAFSNPFKPTPEEIAKTKNTEFYANAGGAYDGPDRPPTPTGVPMPMGYGYGSGYGSGGQGQGAYPQAGYQQYQQQPQQAFVPSGSKVLVPRWTGSAWVYEESPGSSSSSSKSGKKHGHSHRDSESSKRATPTRSYTMPPNAFYGAPSPPLSPGQSGPTYASMYTPPASGTTTPGSGNGMASPGIPGMFGCPPVVIMDSASGHRKSGHGHKLKKKSADSGSIFKRL